MQNSSVGKEDNMVCLKQIFMGLSFGLLGLTTAFAVELRGTASVNVTSDTATTAKNMAFDEARRQIINDALRQYADADALSDLVTNEKSANLMNLISSSSIDGEQTSDTTYSANITMMLDTDAARKWLVENNIRNWVPDGENQDVFSVYVNMSDGLAQWIELNQIARSEKIDVGTQHMAGNTARLEIPVSSRGAFTIALRERGWRYANQDGGLRIWK